MHAAGSPWTPSCSGTHAKADELGISFAEYVRRLVAQDLGEPKPKAHISVIFDLGAAGGRNRERAFEIVR